MISYCSFIHISFLLCALLIRNGAAQPPKGGGIDAEQWLSPVKGELGKSLPCVALATRTLTGKCTSDAETTYGMARLPLFSYVSPTASSKNPARGLPSARLISNTIFDQTRDDIFNARGLNLLFVFFGQFIDHNIIATPNSKQTMAIPVPQNDPNLRGRSSLPFSRSERGKVNSGSAERPLNMLSSPIDLVGVYGPFELRNTQLRGFDSSGSLRALLKTSPQNLLPLNRQRLLNAPDDSNRFFVAGDHRSNEHPVLTAFHTIFLREHNRLVGEIKRKVGPGPEVQIYEAARAMNIAQFQKIVFEEFFPAVIGSNLPSYKGFNSKVNPTISDVFGGAAFRFGHTMVPNIVPLRNAAGQKLKSIGMADLFFRPANTFTVSLMENILRGTAHERAQEVDTVVVDALRNQLFEKVRGEEGFDLVALNLQRSRDHALPSFNELRRLFSIPQARTFRDITKNTAVAQKISKAYNGQINNVEAFVGLLAEDHVRGSSFGRTMIALWMREFTRLRDGDQFFYRVNGIFPEIIRNNFQSWIQKINRPNGISLADIIVANSNIKRWQLPQQIFKVPGSDAPIPTVKPPMVKPPQAGRICTGDKGVCCPRSCGTCGGAGCGSRPGGPSQCCASFILKDNIPCTTKVKTACIQRVNVPTGFICDFKNKICCTARCGECGGVGCGRRPGGLNECCKNHIVRNNVRCSSTVKTGCVL